jgi:hypothetical protein
LADSKHSTLVVHVRRQRLRLASGDVIEDGPKSEAGRRTVAIPEPLAKERRDHLDRFAEEGKGGYVFVSSDGRPLDRNNFRGRIWIPACESCGMEGFRFHDYAAHCGHAGCPHGCHDKGAHGASLLGEEEWRR